MKKSIDSIRKTWGGVTKGLLIFGLGGKLADAFFKKRREHLEGLEPLIDNLNAYDLGKGAGRLIGRWLEYRQPAAEFKDHQATLQDLLKRMDEIEPDFPERARNRFLVSKALFYLEQFRLGQHAYEKVQSEATRLLHLMPQHKTLSKKDVFLGRPFQVENLIGHTHALLIALTPKKEQAHLEKFLKQDAETNPLHEVADYYAQLIAQTFPCVSVPENPDDLADRLERIMMDWFESFKQFQLSRHHRQEKFTKGALAVATGQAPRLTGWKLLRKLRGKN